MKQTLVFVKSMGMVVCKMPSGQDVVLPIVPGVLKHPSPEMLPDLLRKPEVARKYTINALRSAAWQVLRCFPRDWLLECLPAAGLKPARAAAIRFLLA
jgi:hypothetical protein